MVDEMRLREREKMIAARKSGLQAVPNNGDQTAVPVHPVVQDADLASQAQDGASSPSPQATGNQALSSTSGTKPVKPSMLPKPPSSRLPLKRSASSSPERSARRCGVCEDCQKLATMVSEEKNESESEHGL